MTSSGDEIRPYLKALILLQLEALHDESEVKPEVVLARAGIAPKEIAEMLGKNYEAVAKAISRAKGGTTKERLQKLMPPLGSEAE